LFQRHLQLHAKAIGRCSFVIVRSSLITGHCTLVLAFHTLPGALCLCAWAQDTCFTYQGWVTADGTNFTGTGQFKFALVSPGMNTNQTATATAQVGHGAVSMPVHAGLFAVALGNTALTNKSPLPSSASGIRINIQDQPVWIHSESVELGASLAPKTAAAMPRVFSVTNGTYTYYFMARAELDGGGTIWHPQLTLMDFPTAFGGVDP
jgi:hypothetical protein